MRSLTAKLVLAFTLVSLVGILLVAAMAAQFSGDQFREVFEGQNREELINDLGNYYRQNSTWRGIERFASNPRFSQKYAWGFAVVDPQGNVVGKLFLEAYSVRVDALSALVYAQEALGVAGQ